MEETEKGIYMDQKEYDDYLAKHTKELEKLAKENPTKPIASMTLYELNQSVVGTMKSMDKETIRKTVEKVVIPYLQDNSEQFYFTLLNNDLHYYTLFHFSKEPKNYFSFAENLAEIIEDLGSVKSIDLDNNGAIAVWINTDCYYLFPYDIGVVEI